MKKYGFSLRELLYINLRGIALIFKLGKKVPVVLLVSLTCAIQTYWTIWFTAAILDDVTTGAAQEVMIRDLGLFIGGGLVFSLLKAVIDHYYFFLGSGIWDAANIHLNEKILNMDYEYLESENVHNKRRDLEEMAHVDGGGGINMLYWNLMSLIWETVDIVIAVVYMVQMIVKSGNAFQGSRLYSVGFILFTIALTLLGMRKVNYLQKGLFKINNKMIPCFRELSYYVSDYLEKESSGKSIRLFHQQPLIWGHMEELFGKMCRFQAKGFRKWVQIDSITSGIKNLILCIIYFYLGILALKGVLSAGDIFLYAGSLAVFTNSFSIWVSILTQLAGNTKYLKAYFDFLDIPNKKYEGVLPVEKRDDDRYELEFCNVSFRYPGSEEYVLRNFSIHFQIGERLAVVGRNGSGKTTFIKLLCRLYDPTEGEILLNGIDIRKYDYQEYLSLFSVVFQDFKLTAFPLGQNVSASMDYDKDKVKEALIRVGLGELLRKFEMGQGLETPLYTDFDVDGVDISGGEAQKIAIARALYHDVPFEILDEPTAALDPLAEYDVYSKFDDLVGTKTAVYISHRLSSCQFCNDIIVIDKGSVVQHGSHEELAEDRQGLYYKLWNAQAQYYQV